MSSALRAEQPSRTWWSLSSKSSKQDLRKQYANDKSSGSISKNSSGRNFPSFASVIGLKSKKHPTLTIQDPPSPLKSYPSSRPHREIPPQFHPDYQSRARLKSAPQPLSPADSELITPVDGFREGRQSLLTLSDTDPFAGRGITIHGPPSPTRLSAHSNNSFLDVHSKQDKSSLYVRGSYSSSSSNSHSPREPQPHDLLKVRNTSADMRTLSSSKSLSNLQRKPNHADPEPPLPASTQSKSQPNSRPPTRSRGMTESGPTRPPFLQEAHSGTRPRRPSSPGKPPSAAHAMTSPLPSSVGLGSQPSSRPSSRPCSRPPSAGRTTPNQLASAAPVMKTQTISRQTSIQRLQPPTAPPTHELPAPPSKVTEEPTLEDELDIPPACDGSVSSSSLSFVSSISSGREVIASHLDRRREREKHKPDSEKWSFVTSLRPSPEPDVNHSPSSSKSPLSTTLSYRALRKAPSHSSLAKRPPPIQTSTSTSSEPPAETRKTPRKQRSHHRLPIPPISLGFKHCHTASISTPSSPQISEPSVAPSTLEQRRGSATSQTSVPIIPVRRRVFSGSSLRRPSTSSGVALPPKEDDARSLFSLRSDHDVFTGASPFKPWPTNMSTLGSFWDDQPPHSPVRSEYTPQPIMSPEDLAKVEAELDDISVVSALPPPAVPPSSMRERTMSASTVLSDRDSEIIPSSIYSIPLSESTRSPQTPANSMKSGVISVGEAGKSSGAGVGRVASMKSKSSIASPLSRRPATTSGATTLGPVAPMSTIHEPETLENSENVGTSSAPTSDPSPTTPVTPLNIRKAPRKNSNANNNPPLQLRSLPPPPRPRAKAEVVTTAAEPRSSSPNKSHFQSDLKAPIAVDFGHDQRNGHVVSPSIQSMNSGYSMHSTSAASINQPSYAPPVPPRAASRPPPPSAQRPRAGVGGQQPPPSAMSAKISRRISLQRKPSFLDIDDDDDDMESEMHLDFSAIMRMSSASGGASFSRTDYSTAAESFLEFGRESFDTVRSAEFSSGRF